MRLLHTSDWHLGRSLHGVDLLEHQAQYLDHLVELAGEHKVGAVLVSGDVFDRAVPPVEAVTLLSETLSRLAAVTQVVLISGNHDSARRLGFGAQLMRPEIHLVTLPDQVGQVVELGESSAAGPHLVFPIPFLDVDWARVALAPDQEPLARSHQAVLQAAMDKVRSGVARLGGRGRSVVLAHGFVGGGQASDSERDLQVGGIGQVPASLFAGVDYVALGHLHGPQQINSGPGGPLMRYAGSPLTFSFSEMNQVKSTVLVDLGGSEVTTELIPAPVPHRMGEVSGTLEQLLGHRFDQVAKDWLRVWVTDQVRPDSMMETIGKRFPNALVTRHLPQGDLSQPLAGPSPEAVSPMEVANQFVTDVGGQPPTAAESAALQAALDVVLAAEGRA